MGWSSNRDCGFPHERALMHFAPVHTFDKPVVGNYRFHVPIERIDWSRYGNYGYLLFAERNQVPHADVLRQRIDMASFAQYYYKEGFDLIDGLTGQSLADDHPLREKARQAWKRNRTFFFLSL